MTLRSKAFNLISVQLETKSNLCLHSILKITKPHFFFSQSWHFVEWFGESRQCLKYIKINRVSIKALLNHRLFHKTFCNVAACKLHPWLVSIAFSKYSLKRGCSLWYHNDDLYLIPSTISKTQVWKANWYFESKFRR